LARTDPDPAAGHRAFTFFALPLKGTPGITPTFFQDMGRMGISTGGFALEDVRLLAAHQVGFEIMNEVADWFGAMAYTKECPVEMGVRGIRSYSIGAEWTMNIMRLVIARELLGAEFLPYRQ
jgi:alkylation response protein AidB-like acyl-CoA dehydrogenase